MLLMFRVLGGPVLSAVLGGCPACGTLPSDVAALVDVPAVVDLPSLGGPVPRVGWAP